MAIYDCFQYFDEDHMVDLRLNILNQYVVRDNQLAILIDNSIPSLGYQRFKNAR